MVFSSIIFFFLFLPLTILTYTLVGRKFQNLFLLIASLTFYAWGEGKYILVMIVSILINYFCGLIIDRRKGTPSSRTVLIIALFLNISILCFFKYSNFIIDNINILLITLGAPAFSLATIHLPIGISFFTFQAMSYIIDVYRHKVNAQRNLINIGLYISLFPQLIAGPIVRYHDIATELFQRQINRHDFAYGIRRFLFGLSKKVLLANPIAEIADKIFLLPSDGLTISLAWLGALCYTLQIYFDFSGYSDMAIGLGRMFGFHFLENFNYPYIAKSIRDFWSRWHISLSNWLRDYLYIPLGGNRHGNVRTYLNLFIVFILCGLWHGASWTFICWGIYHGFFLTLERTRIGGWLSKAWKPLQHGLTLLLIMFGWVLFRSENISDAYGYMVTMIGFGQGITSQNDIWLYLDNKSQLELFFAIILSVPLFPYVCNIREFISKNCAAPLRNSLDIVFNFTQLFILFSLTYCSIISLAAGVYNPFIYFRF